MNAAEIARALGGKKSGDNYMVRCPAHDDRSPSCSIKDGNNGELVVTCFAGCAGVDVLRAFRAQGFFDDEVREERRPVLSRRAPTTPTSSGLRWSPKADACWRNGQSITGTLAQIYLEGRGCAVPIDADLRFIGADARLEWPTMVARITDLVTGEPMSLHFTRLAKDGLGKASIAKNEQRRLLKGHAKTGGVIRFCADAEVTMGLGIGEGIETCLAVAASGWRPVWSAIDAGNLGLLPVVDGIESLTIFADADPAGIAGAEKLAARWRAAGREAAIIAPPAAGTDWNDDGRAA